MDRVEQALGTIAVALEGSARPAVLWSGGKDSTVVLELARRLRPNIEVILWRVPWMAGKWAFHERVAREWGLTVWDFPPVWAAVAEGNGRVDIMEAYGIGRPGGATMVVARGTEMPEAGMVYGRDFVCGREWLERPKGAAEFPWDALLHGHKSVDVDPLTGAVPLRLDVLDSPGAARVWYPMREWSDVEVWDFIFDNGLPWDENRYEAGPAGMRTMADKRGNSDYYHACTECLRRDGGDFVRCPRWGMDIASVRDRVQRFEPEAAYCGLRQQGK